MRVLQYDAFGRKIVAEFDGLLDAASATRLNSEFIYRAIVTGTRYAGHVWKSPDKLPEADVEARKRKRGIHQRLEAYVKNGGAIKALACKGLQRYEIGQMLGAYHVQEGKWALLDRQLKKSGF